MFVNADCTVFNKRYDCNSRTDIWSRTHIRGVYWESSEGFIGTQRNDFKTDCSLLVVIPEDADTEGKKYLKPNEYKAASHEAAFTFAPEDIIVKGIVPEEIGSGITVKDLQRKYDDLYLITECKDLRFGGNPHLEVSGK